MEHDTGHSYIFQQPAGGLDWSGPDRAMADNERIGAFPPCETPLSVIYQSAQVGLFARMPTHKLQHQPQAIHVSWHPLGGPSLWGDKADLLCPISLPMVPR